ncbi:MAG: hypothetical protein KKA05_07710 [Alphaproteobacteria bacterium]|nr:hypothetical protein [Alphaproteobacteria bacterium]MBU0858588.1 hypothetical protein [Alphaproteobacteria bacterium]
MKFRPALMAALCVAAIAVTAPLPGYALEKQGPVTDADVVTAQSYTDLAKAFGQDTLAFVAIDEVGGRMMMEFLGDGETLENWTRMVTVNVMGLPEDEAAQAPMMFNYIDSFRSHILSQKEQGMAVEMKGFSGFSKTPPDVSDENAPPPQHALYQFAIGKDKADEDNAGIVFPLEGRLVNFQVQRRNGKTVSADEVAILQNILMNTINGDGAVTTDNNKTKIKEE